MDGQELYNLHEAYLEVVENQQLYYEGYKDLGDKARYRGDELRKRAASHTTLGSMVSGVTPHTTPEGQKYQKRAAQQYATSISHSPEESKAKAKANKERGKSKKRAFGNRLRRSDGQGIRDSYDYYDIILSHLLDEGYAETLEAAEAMMVNMSEQWRDCIVEEFLDEAEKPFPYEKVKAKQVALRSQEGRKPLERRMRMGTAVRRAKEAEKTDGSQQDAGKGWYHGK